MPKTYLEPRPCACGCGELIRPRWNPEKQRYSEFKLGHWTKLNPIKSRILSDEQEKEIAQLYSQNRTPTELAKIFSVSRGVITNALRRQKVIFLGRSTLDMRGRVDLHYFDMINTPEKAYWLGFIAADGCITSKKGRYHLTFGQKAEDKNHLKQLLKDLNCNQRMGSKIVKGARYVRLQISGKPLIQHLINLGITPRKSLTLRYPEILSTFDNHFIRGYFDGDGTVSRNRIINQLQFALVGTEQFLRECGIRLQESCALNRIAVYSAGQKTKAYQLSYCGNRQVPRIMRWIYKDATRFLQRKREKYLELCGGEQLELF